MELQILSILGQLEIQLLLACLTPEGEGRIKKQKKITNPVHSNALSTEI